MSKVVHIDDIRNRKKNTHPGRGCPSYRPDLPPHKEPRPVTIQRTTIEDLRHAVRLRESADALITSIKVRIARYADDIQEVGRITGHNTSRTALSLHEVVSCLNEADAHSPKPHLPEPPDGAA